MWFFEQLPEEIRKQMQEAADRAEMAADSYRHDSTRLFSELGKDDLTILRHMLHQLVFDETGKLAAYYEGMAATQLQMKYNVCPSCGVNHDEEAAGFAQEDADAPQTDEVADETIIEYREKAAQKAAEELPQDNVEQMLPSFDLSAEDLQNMEKYHLDDMRDQDSHQILGFLCTGVNNQGPCGMVYPSIEDRMRRAPDVCTGCQQKAAWG